MENYQWEKHILFHCGPNDGDFYTIYLIDEIIEITRYYSTKTNAEGYLEHTVTRINLSNPSAFTDLELIIAS